MSFTKKIASTAALATLLAAGAVSAQTTTPTTTPGTPDTGTGGEAAANTLLLGVSAIIALGGAAYLARRYSQGI